jgi:hypothetical protein
MIGMKSPGLDGGVRAKTGTCSWGRAVPPYYLRGARCLTRLSSIRAARWRAYRQSHQPGQLTCENGRARKAKGRRPPPIRGRHRLDPPLPEGRRGMRPSGRLAREIGQAPVRGAFRIGAVSRPRGDPGARKFTHQLRAIDADMIPMRPSRSLIVEPLFIARTPVHARPLTSGASSPSAVARSIWWSCSSTRICRICSAR